MDTEERGAPEQQAVKQLRQEVLAAVHLYQSRLEQQMQEYQSQRAWRVMLFIRKTYSQLLRFGWTGPFVFLRSLARLATGRAWDLDHFELTFPNLWNYLPESLFMPPHAQVARAAGRNSRTAHRPDVIVLPPFDFLFRFQRPQQIAVSLARMGHRVFWLSLDPRKGREPLTQLREGVWEVRADPTINIYTGALSDAVLAVYEQAFEQLARETGMAEVWVLIQFPFWRRLGLRLRERLGAKLIYDCMDDWQNWNHEPLIPESTLAEEQSLFTEADVAIASSRALCERRSTPECQPLLIPNGADFAFFHSAPEVDVLQKDGSEAIAGYYGALANWFDVELLVAVARLRPQYSFVLIGEVRDRDLSSLRTLPNVRLLGEKNYRQIPGYLHQFDVCLIPFVRTDMTDAVDPVKVYEYFSQGKPVVGTAIREMVRNCGELVYTADDAASFAEQIDRAIVDDDDALRAKRVAFAEANDWHSRAVTLAQAVDATYPLVSIIVLTYNSAEFLLPFWNSIQEHTSYPHYELILVDNNSSDDTRARMEQIAAEGGARVRVIHSERNLGFAGGNNIGAQAARGDYLVFMNPDVLVTRGWVGRLIRALNDPGIGMVAPVTNFSGNETRVNANYKNAAEMEAFAERLAAVKWGEKLEVPMAPLFCVLLTRELWDRLGELDTRFQVGMFEDDDFSLRIRQAGYRIVTAEDCFIHHFGNGSFGKLASPESLRIFERNRAAFEDKWQRSWKPHKTRPGVAPPGPEDRMDPETFLQTTSI